MPIATGGAPDPYGGFRDLEIASESFRGAEDFLQSLLTPGDNRPVAYQRAVKAASGLSEFSEAEGASMVPPDVSADLWSMMLDVRSSPLAWVAVRGCKGNSYTMPATRDDDLTLGLHGVASQLLDEGQQATPVKIPSRKVTHRLAKRQVYVRASDELLDDSPLPALAAPVVASALAYGIGVDILNGSGVGRPLGIAQGGGCNQVSARGGQAVGVIDAANVLAMWASLDPDSRNRAVWLAKPGVETAWYDPSAYTVYSDLLRLVRFREPSEPADAPNMTLLGRPFFGSKAMAAAGLSLLLFDPAHYLVVVKAAGPGGQGNTAALGPDFRVSQHVYFSTHEGALKWTIRHDGRPLLPGPIKQADGTFAYSAASFTPASS